MSNVLQSSGDGWDGAGGGGGCTMPEAEAGVLGCTG